MNYVKSLSCLLLFCVVDIPEAGGQSRRGSGFRGFRELVPYTYPLLGWIESQNRVKCGAALIDQNAALTAASCIAGGIESVHFGDHSRSNITGHEQVFNVTSVVHPDYNSATYEYDVAVLLLNGSATFNAYVDTYLPLLDDKFYDRVIDKHCRVAGWGYETAGAQSDVPYGITVDKKVKCSHAGASSKRAICYEQFRNPHAITCAGDVGGPYLCKKKRQWMLAGIMSGYRVEPNCLPGPRAVTTLPSIIAWITNTTVQ